MARKSAIAKDTMELRHLRYFVAAAEEEHFGRAADRLCVTRPAVSQIVADLEDEIGVLLFERLAHRVVLTAAGRALLPQVRAIISELSEAIAVAKRVGEGRSGVLKVGYGSLTLLNTVFRSTIKKFRDAFPDVTLALVELKSGEQPKALAEGRIDCGFMHFGPGRILNRERRDRKGAGQREIVLDWLPIQKGNLGVAVPIGHKLAARKSVSIQDLAEEDLVVVPGSSVSPDYGPVYGLFQEIGVSPKIVQEVVSIASQLNLISVGMGVGLVVMGRNFRYPDELTVIPLSGVQYSTDFVFGWVEGKKSPALERMIEILDTASKAE